MKETRGRAAIYSLEDLIRAHPKKPAKEMLQGVAQARNIMQEFGLSRVLGINSIDTVLFHTFLAERIIKTRIYDFDWITHSPEFIFTPRDIEKDDKARARLQDSLDALVSGRNQIIQDSYPERNMRLRARNLELAANDLVARGSEYDEEYFSTHIVISDESVDSWGEKWQKEFKTRVGHARQKHLHYQR